jgi:hypothetical protein
MEFQRFKDQVPPSPHHPFAGPKRETLSMSHYLDLIHNTVYCLLALFTKKKLIPNKMIL